TPSPSRGCSEDAGSNKLQPQRAGVMSHLPRVAIGVGEVARVAAPLTLAGWVQHGCARRYCGGHNRIHLVGLGHVVSQSERRTASAFFKRSYLRFERRSAPKRKQERRGDPYKADLIRHLEHRLPAKTINVELARSRHICNGKRY